MGRPLHFEDQVRFEVAGATPDSFGGAVKSCLAGGSNGTSHTEESSYADPGRCYARCFLHSVNSSLLLLDQRWCNSGWRRGGMGRHRFQFLLQRHLVNDVSLVRQMMIVDA